MVCGSMAKENWFVLVSTIYTNTPCNCSSMSATCLRCIAIVIITVAS